MTHAQALWYTGPGQVAIRDQTLGDGELRSFSLPHNLGTANGTIAIRENAPNGRLLVLGDDYEIRFPSDNEIVVDFSEVFLFLHGVETLLSWQLRLLGESGLSGDYFALHE